MKDIKWYIGILLALSTAFFLLFSFPLYNVNYLAFIALAPIFFITYTTNIKKTTLYGITSGFLFYALYLSWMNAYLPIIGVTFVTLVYGGCFVFSLVLINIVSSVFQKYRVILTPFIWIAIEYIRSFGFLGFTFGSIGYTQHNFLRFIQIADIGGEPLVSFIIVLFNASIAELFIYIINNKPFIKEGGTNMRHLLSIRPFIQIFIPIGIITLSLIYGTFRLNENIPQNPKMKISLIQSLSSPRTKWADEKWNTLKRLMDLSKECYLKNPDTDLIVWTETAIRTSLRPNIIYGTPYHNRITRLIKQLKTQFIIGSPDNYNIKMERHINPENLTSIYPEKGEEDIWTNSAYFLDKDGDIVAKYDKMKLTPFGEHFPYGKTFPFLQKILDKFTDSADFTPGTDYTVFKNSKLDFSVVICWEGTYGYFIRKFINNGAQFIINISNDMWTQTKKGHFQHFSLTKFRAIENRIWYARAANDGVTAIINPYGETVNIIPIKKLGYLTADIGPKVRTTFYTKYGDILPIISLLVLGISFIFSLIILIKKPV